MSFGRLWMLAISRRLTSPMRSGMALWTAARSAGTLIPYKEATFTSSRHWLPVPFPWRQALTPNFWQLKRVLRNTIFQVPPLCRGLVENQARETFFINLLARMQAAMMILNLKSHDHAQWTSVNYVGASHSWVHAPLPAGHTAPSPVGQCPTLPCSARAVWAELLCYECYAPDCRY